MSGGSGLVLSVGARALTGARYKLTEKVNDIHILLKVIALPQLSQKSDRIPDDNAKVGDRSLTNYLKETISGDKKLCFYNSS